ncbi:MAG: hypothetical protein LBP42_04455, partial [Treponema sp.]|nr:hypothetical protein [Treponema sp.]
MPHKNLMHNKGLFFILLFAGEIFSLHGRDVEITVEDGDLQLPLEGALVRSWDGEEFICNEAGKVTIPAPEDRQVVVLIAYPGYENSRLVISPGKSAFTLGLHLSGVMENRELVIEARRPGASETKSGRSTAVSDEALARTARIGLIEDVMSSVKLLPGVGYTGMFSALPSIRGGEPGDLIAVLDGFYIENPYHWGGGFSIFDPKMVQSAQLSHGVFSARSGHTISGLLELSSKKPSAAGAELELGLSTSAAGLNLSYPLGTKGGIMLMGKLSYWDPFIWLAKQFLEEARYIRKAPYIHSAAFSADYRFSYNLEWTLNGLFGSDGIGVSYENPVRKERLESESDLSFDWNNKIGFFITGLTFNPTNTMVLKAKAGAGFHQSLADGWILNDVKVGYSPDFIERWDSALDGIQDGLIFGRDSYHLENQRQSIYTDETTFTVQGRADFDWNLGRGFLFAAGAQELYSQWLITNRLRIFREELRDNLMVNGEPIPLGFINFPASLNLDIRNRGYISSAYTLLEYSSPGRRFGAELGLRGDHAYFTGADQDYAIQTLPAANPRLNLDFSLLKNRGILESLTAAAGTGLFSSINETASLIQTASLGENSGIKPNRSWTSVLGVKLDFIGGYTLNIEGYYKYIFNRAYTVTEYDPGTYREEPRFDGEGRSWGFDLMLQKLESRHWDGWLSYSFNHARYRDPQAPKTDALSGWYYPSFHRFHYLNLVLNIKPVKRFQIASRFGLASGRPVNKAEKDIISYPVIIVDEGGNPTGLVIEKWKRGSRYSDEERTPWSIPLDVKFSFFTFDPQGKVRQEIYLGVENLLALVY